MRKLLIAAALAAGLTAAVPAVASRSAQGLTQQQKLERFLANHPRLQQRVQAKKARRLVVGQVKDVGDGYFSLTFNHDDWVIEVTQATKLRQHGRAISLDQIKPGDHVIVLATKVAGASTARAVLVRKY